ncbi:MAG TPA: TerC/Alx family metal homeostasis membrane protein [Solirubrobacteraceae bacterium]|nr:TerC/Alx family metal homeostasis membrane protein [Solirubrobacteraceae bacterium]
MSPVAWAATLLLIGALLALDLVRSARRPHAVGAREAVVWSLFYVGIAVSFGLALGVIGGWDLSAQYLAGYAVEKSLSVDNLFVFVVILASFGVPPEQHARALTFGIVLALGLRAVFIALGAALLATFSFLFAVFGLILLASAVQLLRHRDRRPQPGQSPLIALVRRRLPVSARYDAGRLTTGTSGTRALTPMALVLLALGTTDLVFALDSIPAVFGVTSHAYIVFCANAFALLGLRALFFVVSALLARLVFLATGLATVLGVIGVKLLLHYAHTVVPGVPEISTGASLAVIASVLTVTTVASLLATRREVGSRPHARPAGATTAAAAAPTTAAAAAAAAAAEGS